MGGDYTEEAVALFARFAERHQLHYEVDESAPIEVLWNFPVQEKLTLPITLGLQNGDELNFGISDFWSYFFPFPKVVARFEQVIDAWVTGDARVAVTGPWGRVLQVWQKDHWQFVYGANRILPFWRKPRRTIENKKRDAGAPDGSSAIAD